MELYRHEWFAPFEINLNFILVERWCLHFYLFFMSFFRSIDSENKLTPAAQSLKTKALSQVRSAIDKPSVGLLFEYSNHKQTKNIVVVSNEFRRSSIE